MRNGEGKERQLATENFGMRGKGRLRIKNNQVHLTNTTSMFLCHLEHSSKRLSCLHIKNTEKMNRNKKNGNLKNNKKSFHSTRGAKREALMSEHRHSLHRRFCLKLRTC